MTEKPLAAFPVLANRISVIVEGSDLDALIHFLDHADLRVEQDGKLLAEGPVYCFPAGRGLHREEDDPRGKVETFLANANPTVEPFLADANTLVATIIAREPLKTPLVRVIASGLAGLVYVTVPPANLDTGEQVSSPLTP